MRSVFDQYHYNVSVGPTHEPAAALPAAPPVSAPVRVVAYYLPQFHPIPENDEWWGTGFTEWTNVTKALPRYVGHQQPRLPADLGFYDLRQSDVLRRQADLARRGGLHGFCIHDYWFSGRKVLETPLRVLLDNPDIDLPFCLNWANEPWSRRWDGSDHDVLLHQNYDPDDDLGYVRSILPSLRDPRYIRVGGRPLVMIYRPSLLPDAARMMDRWRAFLVAEGVGDPYLVMAQTYDDYDPRPYGMDAAAGFPPHNGGWTARNRRNALRWLDRDYFDGFTGSFDDMVRRTLANDPQDYRLFPGVCPTWDNEARKPGRGYGFYGSTPEVYGRWLRQAVTRAAAAPDADERIVFVNAWNEWAEGAVLEPDRHFGYAYLAETRRALDEAAGLPLAPRAAAGALRERRAADPQPSARNVVVNRLRRVRRKVLRALPGR